MIVIYGLDMFKTHYDPEVISVFEHLRFDYTALATASVEWCLKYGTSKNLDFMATISNIWDIDQDVYVIKQTMPAMPFSTERLRTIYLEICYLIHLDIFGHVTNLFKPTILTDLDYFEIVWCNLDSVAVRYVSQ